MSRIQRRIAIVLIVATIMSLIPLAAASASGPTYVVQPGDTLYGVAVQHGTTVAALMRMNNLPSTTIYVGQRLTVPSGGYSASDTYTVQYGDTLYGIARTFGVSAATLARANNLNLNSWVYAGQQLRIPGRDSTDASPSTGTDVYTVRPGDTLITIAYRQGVSVGALAQVNGIRVDSWVYVGQRLRLPRGANTPAAPQPRQQPPARDGYYHIVRPGETVAYIAGQYGISSTRLVQANSIRNPSKIYVGQRLLIPGYAPKPSRKPAQPPPTTTKPPGSAKPPTTTQPPYVQPSSGKPAPSQKPGAVEPKAPAVMKKWVGEVVESNCTDEDTLEFRSVLRINVEGRTDQPIDIYALPVQESTFVTWLKTGTKPELGETGAEVAPLKAGYYAIIPAGLDTQLNVWVDGSCTIYVNFKQVSV